MDVVVHIAKTKTYQEIICRFCQTEKDNVEQYAISIASKNGVKCFWLLLERSMEGTNHHVSARCLGQYVGEFTGRHP